jgi:hypothetical protein
MEREDTLHLRRRTLARIDAGFPGLMECLACRRDLFAWLDEPANRHMHEGLRITVSGHSIRVEATPEMAGRIEGWFDGWNEAASENRHDGAAATAAARAARHSARR